MVARHAQPKDRGDTVGPDSWEKRVAGGNNDGDCDIDGDVEL